MTRLLAGLLLFLFTSSCLAQSPASGGDAVFEARCSICHGGDGSGGGRAPSLLGFVRYHTDPELKSLIHDGRVEKGMPSFDFSSEDLDRLLSHLRTLAGSNAAMSTAGYTGNAPMKAGKYKPPPGPHPGTVHLVDGRNLSGTVIESDYSAQVLTKDGTYHLLTRDGQHYNEKPILPKRDWTTYNGNDSGNRFSTLKQIDTANVNRLSLAWLFPFDASRLETTPIVKDGVMYITGWNEAYALDSATGQQLWMYRQPHTKGLVSEAGRGTNRGVAIWNDSVFMVTDNAHLLALSRIDGHKLWDVEMGAVIDGYSATAAPLVVGDLIISGVAGGEEGARGFVSAYKASTGERVWRFYSIPQRGEKAASTWVGSALEHGCGATWLTGSYDAALDMIYWTTGNPCPDFNGDERKGDNLYTSSVVALSAKTGELKWYYQFTPHDTHDWDAEQPVLLVDQPWNGKPRKLLIHANRNGFFFVLDRKNGELLLAKPFVKTTWASGYDRSGRPILTDSSESSEKGELICPASSGGTNWYSSSWNPQTKLFYLRANEWCAVYKKQQDPLIENRWYGGVAPNQSNAESYLRALDISTGKKIWEKPLSTNNRGGVLSTAGGLIFAGGPSGTFLALDARTGKTLKHINVGQDWQASPMTFMVGGKQFVALAGASGVFVFSLVP
ncbi:PQQ-dependent dehydrogenase, methanol/ethanol family [Terriglobus sp. TAA 43]|uniref:PQQ-dependent dehydrogenase, methanol/ethanol family n=1 Tax=Terriglobus sp. TAA 43 TaxID=278961 RepID=UPI00068FCB8F|nr:PQQ-dependent dehydrogenase, methanol/ethanol family [Terriglobus sp. TAA 43]